MDSLLPFTLIILLIFRYLRATSVSKKVDCQFLFFPISGLPLTPIVAPLWGAAKSESSSESTFAEPGAVAFCFMLFLQRAPHLPLPEKGLLSNFPCYPCHSCHSCKKNRKNKRNRKTRSPTTSRVSFLIPENKGWRMCWGGDEKKEVVSTAETTSSCIVSRLTIFVYCQMSDYFSNLGPAATSALPSSLVVNFEKFLMNLPAKSSALTVHSASAA